MKSEQLPQTAETSEINQWDPGLRASMEFCLAALVDCFECHCGYEINKRPNEADMVIVKKAGVGIFPIQILAYGEMEDDRWLVLRSMTRKMTPEMRAAVRDVLVPFCTDEEREKLVETIVYTYFKANKKLFEEGDSMYEWLEPVYKPKMDRIAAESRVLGRSEGIALGEARGIREGGLNMLFGLVRDNMLTAQSAADRAKLPLAAFNAKMAEYEARP